jgi:hypothetical protein
MFLRLVITKMGAGMSSFFLMGGLVVAAILDTYAAMEAEKKDWSNVKMYAGITTAITLGLVALAMFILVKSGGGLGGDVFIGVDLAFLISMAASIAIGVLNVFALSNMSQDGHKFTSWGAVTACVGFVVACTVILFLF